MATLTSFTSRRPAAGALPTFSLPPPSEIPRSDGLSPTALSSVHTAGSQGSQGHSTMQYTYGAPTHAGWNGNSSSPYHAQGQQAMPQSPYGSRPSMYGQTTGMSYSNPRNSQSPTATSENMSGSFDQVHHSFGHGSGQDSHGSMTSGAPAHTSILTGQHSGQPATPSSATSQVDPYAFSRPPSNPSYYTSSNTQQNFGYGQPSPTQPSPPSSSRSLHSQTGMGSYRPYTYQPVSNMSGPVMSNMHQPGSQMSMMAANMGVSPSYGAHPMMYSHNQPQQQQEKPFKCDQCTQAFSRNHDLKRHKRIHLAVKPFPCSYCSKSFSRKDALKRHRLVKGCENKVNEDNADDDRRNHLDMTPRKDL